MDISKGFRLQLSPLPALDQSLVKRGVLVRLGLGWFGGVITRRAHQISRCEYDYCVILHADGSTNSLKLPLESYSTDEGATVGAWVLLEAGEQGGVRRSGRALIPNVRNAELSA